MIAWYNQIRWTTLDIENNKIDQQLLQKAIRDIQKNQELQIDKDLQALITKFETQK